MKHQILLILAFVMAAMGGCKDESNTSKSSDMHINFSSIVDGSTDISCNTEQIKLSYNYIVAAINENEITLEGGNATITSVSISSESAATVLITVNGLSSLTTYTLKLSNDAIRNENGDCADAVSITFTTAEQKTNIGSLDEEGMEMGAQELLSQIKVGWNLGNTLEAAGEWASEADQETTWGNPVTTKAMIDAVKAAGFNAVRIPVRWYPHSEEGLTLEIARTAKTLTIKKSWLEHVKTIVDYCIDNNMYVILNSHHDQWYDRMNPASFDSDLVNNKLAQLWTQIATFFANYDQHLIFAGTNEVITVENGVENWSTPSAANQAIQNKFNQTFVDAVRATGGKNAVRCLCVQTWACNPDFGLSGFTFPTDAVEGRIMIEFHDYRPWDYAAYTNAGKYTWGTSAEIAEVGSLFKKLKEAWYDKGYGVVMGEFGAAYKYKGDAPTETELQTRELYMKTKVSTAKQYNIPGFYWDNGGKNQVGSNGYLNSSKEGSEVFAIFDRWNDMKIIEPYALRGIMEGVE
ncbi:MAG: hypothetical protein E7069_09055 [Bacteroidales bacterium]|jgi:endoglucanase|nr:hypothetical protein [Bacteroidales bacterium]